MRLSKVRRVDCTSQAGGITSINYVGKYEI
jgi:hypothetical protein